MNSVNKVVLIGNVGKDPEMRYTTTGDAIASFSLATNETWTDKAGQKQERTFWHHIEAFGKPAEICRDYVKKGKQMYVEGTLKYDEFVDKDGVKRNITKIKVSGFNSRIVLIGPKQKELPLDEVEQEAAA